MKKISTLLAITTLTIGGVNAEENVFFNLDKTPTNAQVVTSVTDITATYGGATSVDKTGTPVAADPDGKWSEGADWKNDLKQKAFTYTLDGTAYKFTHYAESVDNSRGEKYSFSSNAPVYGGFVKYEPVANGKLIAYFYVPDNKPVVFTEVSASNAEGTNLILSGDAKIYTENGTNVSVSETGIPNATYKKTVAVLECDLKANNTYYLQLNGSKLGVGGFIFASEGKAEEPVEGTVFKVQGMGGATYGEEFDEISTPFSFDRANMTATFNNLFGSEASISIKYEQNDPAADPSVIGTMFNSKSATGIEEDGGDYAPYTIKNFTGSVVIKKDGVNYAKLENIGLWLGYYSQVQVAVEGSGDNAKKVYKVTFMIGGEYYPWDATTSSWGEKAKYNDNIELTTTIPFEEGDQSGIEDIVTDNVDENAPVEYYNLQGIRLSEPAAGQIVIRRQGSKVSKILVK